jgi:hypothetical protein
MTERILGFYEPLADHYHLIFDDWNRVIERQSKILNRLLVAQMGSHPLKILDLYLRDWNSGTRIRGLRPSGDRLGPESCRDKQGKARAAV